MFFVQFIEIYVLTGVAHFMSSSKMTSIQVQYVSLLHFCGSRALQCLFPIILWQASQKTELRLHSYWLALCHAHRTPTDQVCSLDLYSSLCSVVSVSQSQFINEQSIAMPWSDTDVFTPDKFSACHSCCPNFWSDVIQYFRLQPSLYCTSPPRMSIKRTAHSSYNTARRLQSGRRDCILYMVFVPRKTQPNKRL